MHDRRETKVTVPMGKATKTIPPFNPGIFGGGHIPPDHVEYTTPTYFLGFQKTWGGPPDVKLFPGYIRIYQVDIHRSKKQTAYDLCELLLLVFEDSQKILLLQWIFFAGGVLEL